MMNKFKKIKCFFKRLNPFYKNVKIDISLYQDEFVILKLYSFSDRYNKGVYVYLGNGKFREIENKFRIHTINHSKQEREARTKARHWYHKARYIYFPNGQEFYLDVSTGYPNSFYFEVSNGSDYNCTIHFWFIFNIFFSVKKLPRFYMNWFTKRLKRYSYSKCFSLSFHHWRFWWNFWNDDDSFGSKNKFRKGSFDIKRFVLGDDKCKTNYKDYYTMKVFFKEGSYDITSIRGVFSKKYKRFGFIFNKRYNTYYISTGKFEGIKSFDELRCYQIVQIGDDSYFELNNGKRTFLIEKFNDSMNPTNSYMTQNDNVSKIESVNKKTKTVKLKCGREVHWGCIRAAIKKETGVPIPSDAIYSSGAYKCNDHYESISKFLSIIIKERGGWNPE